MITDKGTTAVLTAKELLQRRYASKNLCKNNWVFWISRGAAVYGHVV
jgi:hypothetical protein